MSDFLKDWWCLEAIAEKFGYHTASMIAKLAGEEILTLRQRVEELEGDLHLARGVITDPYGNVIGWRTCDCSVCERAGRGPAGPGVKDE